MLWKQSGGAGSLAATGLGVSHSKSLDDRANDFFLLEL
jgi:hypothetical protein